MSIGETPIQKIYDEIQELPIPAIETLMLFAEGILERKKFKKNAETH